MRYDIPDNKVNDLRSKPLTVFREISSANYQKSHYFNIFD